MLKRFCSRAVQIKWYSTSDSSLKPSATSQWATDADDIRNVLCDGPILRAVQNSNVFPDCKTFVDMSIKTSIAAVWTDWKQIEAQYGQAPIPKPAVLEFLQKNFEKVEGDSQLLKWVPSDWKPNPPIIEKLSSTEYKYFAKELNHLWLKLGRKMSADVQTNTSKTSLIYIPNGFIIPGGRFRELYYWDTYFILLGLLVCDMFETARGVLENMLHLLKAYGSIYNGTRVYYQFRSQPPLLLKMVDDYVTKIGDISFVRNNYKVLENEIMFWENRRTVDVQYEGETYKMFRYFCCPPGPRPESYREDVATAECDITPEAKLYKYQAIASACESGWDFSSRWFKCRRDHKLVDLHTQEMLPVDLNSFMHMNYEILSKWAAMLEVENDVRKYSTKSRRLRVAIEDLLWHETDGIWYDRNVKTGEISRQFAASNFTPLWTKSFDEAKKAEIAERMLDYYLNLNLWKFKGGIPTTMCFSGEQWDWPNSWAPLQLITSEGFREIGLPAIAFGIANNWVNNNYTGYLKHNVIFEKYDCRRPGMTGFGGEYVEQEGFGWSNGVVFSFMNSYPEQLAPFPPEEPRKLDSTESLVQEKEKEQRSTWAGKTFST